MNSRKMFLYDFRMTVTSKVFIGFVLACIVFSYSLMRNLTVLGVADTAPFSQWSYSSFLCSLNSMLLPLLLLLCSRIYEKRELRVRPLIFSTAISDAQYFLIKGAAVFSAFILSALASITVSFTFYTVIFNFSDFASLMLPILLFLIPSAIFVFGLGMLLGSADEWLIYLLTPAAFLLPIIKPRLPVCLDLFCGYLISDYPEEVMSMTADSTAAFILPQGFLAGRCLFILAGLAFFTVACFRKTGRSK